MPPRPNIRRQKRRLSPASLAPIPFFGCPFPAPRRWLASLCPGPGKAMLHHPGLSLQNATAKTAAHRIRFVIRFTLQQTRLNRRTGTLQN